MNNKNSDSVSSEICISQKHFICDVCNKKFYTKFHYQIHSVTHLLPEQLESCHECQEGSAHILTLDKHLEIHNSSVCITSMTEHGKTNNSDSSNTFIPQQNANDETVLTNNHNEKHSASDRVQNPFSCDRCKKEFPEKHNLEEHIRNHCIKKELNADKYDDFVPFSEMTASFQASDDVISSGVPEKSKTIRIFTTKIHEQQNEKKNVHTQDSSKTTQFVCEVCQVTFSKKCSLIIHLSRHSDHKTFKCRLCEKKFILKSLLNAHRQTHKVKNVFCGVCQKGFDSKEKLFNHVHIHALVESFSCDICQMTFSEKALLEKHHRRHNTEKKFTDEVKCSQSEKLQNLKCYKCEKEFLKKDHLEEHCRSHCIKKEFDCDEYIVPYSSKGRKILPSYKALNMDKTDHSLKFLLEKPNLTQTEKKKSEKYWTCEVCQRKFYSQRTLNDHKHIHLGSFPHVCNICSKGFARLDHLKRHYQIHSKVSKTKECSKKALNIRNSTKSVSSYVCDVCSKEFARKDHLKRHYVIHTRVSLKKLPSDPSYFCEFCSKEFTRPDHLYDHYQTHSGQKPWRCEVCGSNYRHKTNFIKHQQTHQQSVKEIKLEKYHACSFCSKTFKRPDHLKRHLLIHAGKKPFKCETCGVSFNQKGTLTKHKMIHQQQESGIMKKSRISKKKKK